MSLGLILFLYSCKKDPQVLDASAGFPDDIQRIFQK